jgi:hypothetical protein
MKPASRFLAALALLLFIALPAQACINNDRTGIEERRFRSRYRSQRGAEPQKWEQLAGGLGMSALGLGLLYSALKRVRKAKEA